MRILKYIGVFVGVLVALAVGFFYIAANHSAVERDYACTGITNGEADQGRLRIVDYRFWVDLWSDGTDGNIKFQSKKIAMVYISKIRRSGDKGFRLWMDYDPKKNFVFREATGEIGIKDYGNTNFSGECTPSVF